jgi:type III restriction enzyme
MANPFFDHPILNSPYEYPTKHWELDESGQPTQKTVESRRPASFVTPIPRPKKQKGGPTAEQMTKEFVFDEGKGLSTKEQEYDVTSIINEVRKQVGTWRALPPSQWQVTPETARLLQHWWHHPFSDARPFFCQVEAVETAIWLTEVAPYSKAGKRLLDHLAFANRDANLELQRAQARHRRGQNHRHGHGHRLADHQCCAPPGKQAFHPRLSRRGPGVDH